MSTLQLIPLCNSPMQIRDILNNYKNSHIKHLSLSAYSTPNALTRKQLPEARACKITQELTKPSCTLQLLYMHPSTILVNDFRKDQFDLATYSNYSQVELQYCIHKRQGDRTHAKESREKLACRNAGHLTNLQDKCDQVAADFSDMKSESALCGRQERQ